MDNYQLENFKEVLKSCFNPIEGYSNFSDWLFDYLTYNYPDIAFRFEDQADLVAAILDDLAYSYDVYFSEFGFYKKTYIITLKGRSKANIYKDLKIEDEGILYPEFVTGIHKVNADGQLEEQITEKLKNESLDEAKQNKFKYFYSGPVYKFNAIYQENWAGDTWAVSDKQALNQLTYQFKKQSGWVADTAFHLDPNYLMRDGSQVITPKKEDPKVIAKPREIKYCDKCGTRLTDGGYCPVCDDGDEEALHEDIKMLDITTPYMLRKDGRLIRCGEIHPYIKMSQTASDETNLKTLEEHPEFLNWFESHVLDASTAQLIDEFEKSIDINEKYELMDLLNDITNQEFCRVRTSNYKVKYGGDNGEIYFRISSRGFNWFNLIWDIVNKYQKQIKNVTIVNDKQSTGGKEFDYYYDHIPVDEFLTLKGSLVIENYSGKTSKVKNLKPIGALNEDIEKHDELNPLLFENDELKDDVKEAIEKIAEEFVKELKADKIKFYLEDIVLVGSNVSYNYTKNSDLDIHLIASSDELKCPDNLYPLLYSAYRSIFNKNFNLNINGIPVEIYVEMDKPTGKSNGIYSIYNGWLKHPVQEDIPDIDQEAFDKLFNEWEDKYFELEHSTPDEKIIDKFIEDLYALRKDSIVNDGEYGVGNLIFKEFRSLGYLDHLKELKRKQLEKDLSLESMNN